MKKSYTKPSPGYQAPVFKYQEIRAALLTVLLVSGSIFSILGISAAEAQFGIHILLDQVGPKIGGRCLPEKTIYTRIAWYGGQDGID